MSRIPDQTIEQIMTRISIVEVVGRYVKLKRSGRRMVGLCPFHNEKTPSFGVDPERNLYYCFGCQAGGSVFNFLMEMEGLNFRQSVQKLGAEVGIEVVFTEDDSEEHESRKRLLELLERTAVYYHDLLFKSPLGKQGLEYCARRGLGRPIMEKFRLGWAPGDGKALAIKVKQAGYTEEDGVLAGVLRERGGKVQDTLRNRLVFPICDVQGRVVAFGGRVLGDGTPKYLNTPETEVYSKRHHLFGLSNHRGAISRAEKAVVAEGYLDVIAMSQVGVELGVASLGTALTEEQTRLLSRYTRDVILAYDADRAGQSATVKAIELFEQAGLRIFVATMAEGEDPDTLARDGGPQAVEALIEDAISVIDFAIRRAAGRFDLKTPEGKQDFSREVLPAIGRITDSVRRDAYLRRVASMMGVSEQRLGWKLQSQKTASSGPSRSPRRRALDSEETLLRICAVEPRWIAKVRERLAPNSFQRKDLRPLFQAVFEHEGREEPIGLQQLVGDIEDREAVVFVTELLAQEPPHTSEDDMEKLLRSVEQRSRQSRLEQLRQEVLRATAEGKLSSEDELYKEYLQLQQQLKGVR